MATRREKRREKRREQILAAAMEIVVQDGLDGLTIARLAGDIGAAVGALYRYFPGKDAIIVELEKRSIAEYAAAFQSRIERTQELLASRNDVDEDVAAFVTLIAALASYLDDAIVAPERHRLIDSVVSTPAKLLQDDDARKVNETLDPLLDHYGRLIDEAVAVGALDEGDAAQRTHVLWAGLHGLDHFRKRDRLQPERLKVPALFRATIESLLCGWGGERDVIREALDVYDAFSDRLLADARAARAEESTNDGSTDEGSDGE